MGRSRWRVLQRVAGLTAREIADLALAQQQLCLAWWIVRRRGTGCLLHRAPESDTSAVRRGDQWIVRMATAVDRVARLGLFRPTCLIRSIALERLIDRAGCGGAIVRVGVLRQGDTLLAHAWIELDDRVIGDEPAFVRRFTPLQPFSALSR